MRILEKLILSAVVLYLIALSTSNAGMELFSHLILFLTLIYGAFDRSLFKQFKKVPTLLLVGFAGYILTSTVSIIFKTPDDFDRLKIFFDFRWILILLSLALVVGRFYNKNWQYAWHATLLATALSAVYGVWQGFNGIDLVRQTSNHLILAHGHWRSVGFFGIPLTYAYVMGVSTLVVLGSLVVTQDNYSWGRKLWLLFVFCAGFLAVGLSQTRGAWVAMLLAFVTLLFIYPNKKSYIVNLVMVFFIGVGVLASGGVHDRLSSIANIREPSNQGRIYVWKAHMKLFKANPLLGVGLDYNRDAMYKYCAEKEKPLCFASHAHNNLINTLSGSGLIGTLFFLLFIWSLLSMNWKLIKCLDKKSFEFCLMVGAFLAQIYFHMGGLTESNLLDSEVNHSMIVVWAMVVGIYIRSHEQLKEAPCEV